MLHATLHGKLSDQIPEPQRLEDALTSTVFGTLVLVDAASILGAWFAAAEGGVREPAVGDVEADQQPFRVWFWPRLAHAEPDVVMQWGGRVFVVEAKLGSGRHDAAIGQGLTSEDGGDDEAAALVVDLPSDESLEDAGLGGASRSDESAGGVRIAGRDESDADQLCRQERSVADVVAGVWPVAGGLGRALRECAVTYVYLVDQRRMRRARREFNESASRLPHGTDLQLLTWQDLYRILRYRVDGASGARWMEDLIEYLELTGVDGYAGIRLLRFDQERARRLTSWSGGTGAGSRSRWKHAMTLLGKGEPEQLMGWHLDGAGHGPRRFASAIMLDGAIATAGRRLTQWSTGPGARRARRRLLPVTAQDLAGSGGRLLRWSAPASKTGRRAGLHRSARMMAARGGETLRRFRVRGKKR